MYKSRQKIIGVSITSVVVLGAFGVASWAIIDASNNIPKADAQKAYYAGKTSYLIENGGLAFDTDTMSVYDWINANYPTKLLYEKKDTNSYSIYYYTDPDSKRLGLANNAGTTFNFSTYNTVDDLLALNSKISSPLICRVDVTETNNSYSYSVYVDNPTDEEGEIVLSSSTINFTDTNKTGIDSVNGNSANGGEYNVSSSNNNLVYAQNTINYSGKNEGSYSLNMNVLANSTNENTFSWSLSMNNKISFAITNSGQDTGTNRDYITGTYTLQSNMTGDSTKYKIYNVSYTGSQNVNNKNTYQYFWKEDSSGSLARLHLPDEIGMIGYLPNIFN